MTFPVSAVTVQMQAPPPPPPASFKLAPAPASCPPFSAVSAASASARSTSQPRRLRPVTAQPELETNFKLNSFSSSSSRHNDNCAVATQHQLRVCTKDVRVRFAPDPLGISNVSHHHQRKPLAPGSASFFKGTRTQAAAGLTTSQTSPPSELEHAQVHHLTSFEPPPRDPRRRLSRYQSRYRHLALTRPPSSIYDEEHIGLGHFDTYCRPGNMDGHPTADQISPLSSPSLIDGHYEPSYDDVSPIDEEAEAAQQDLIRGKRTSIVQDSDLRPAAKEQRSSIPTARRDRRRRDDASRAAERGALHADGPGGNQPTHPKPLIPRSDGTRWDATGAPTYQGRHSPVNSLGTQAHIVPTDLKPPQSHHHFGSTTVISGPGSNPTRTASPSFGQRMKQLGRGKAEPVEDRPEWSGASGRMPLAQPVRDNPHAPQLKVPQKSNKKTSRGAIPFTSSMSPVSPPGSDNPSGARAAVRRLMPSRMQDGATKRTRGISQPQATHHIMATPGSNPYPSPPNDSSPTERPTRPPHHGEGMSTPPRVTPETMPDSSRVVKRKPPPTARIQTNSHAVQLSTSSSTSPAENAGVTRVISSSPIDEPPSPSDNWIQPTSRFSITTYATSRAESPRQSLEEDRPPLPTPPGQSVMERGRPRRGDENSVPQSPEEPIILDGVGPAATSFDNEDSTTRLRNPKRTSDAYETDRRASIMSLSKALPPLPLESMATNDRIGYLNARLESLAHRRINIIKSIKQMTELMPQDSFMASSDVLKKREMEKQKVEVLKEELSEVQQEEYELGLKLHRAYKRQDREGENESSGLWIKRVTG